MTEKWKPVPGYEGLYEASSLGRIRSFIHRRGDGILQGHIDRYGYRCVNLKKDGRQSTKAVHLLVCSAFHGLKPEGMECGHKNGIKLDNQADNLGYISRSQNVKDQVRHGHHRGSGNLVIRSGEDHPQARLSDEQVVAIRADATAGLSEQILSRKYGISRSHAHRIVRNQTRKTTGQAPDLRTVPSGRERELGIQMLNDDALNAGAPSGKEREALAQLVSAFEGSEVKLTDEQERALEDAAATLDGTAVPEPSRQEGEGQVPQYELCNCNIGDCIRRYRTCREDR